MFILLLSTMPQAAMDRWTNRALTSHVHRPTIRVRIRRIMIAALAHVFHVIGIDRY